jgi:hypothetical protein
MGASNTEGPPWSTLRHRYVGSDRLPLGERGDGPREGGGRQGVKGRENELEGSREAGLDDNSCFKHHAQSQTHLEIRPQCAWVDRIGDFLGGSRGRVYEGGKEEEGAQERAKGDRNVLRCDCAVVGWVGPAGGALTHPRPWCRRPGRPQSRGSGCRAATA